MTDKTLDRLELFEERFDAHGHDVAIETLQTTEIGETIFRCKRCAEIALVETTNTHGGWYLPETKLDLRCSGTLR